MKSIWVVVALCALGGCRTDDGSRRSMAPTKTDSSVATIDASLLSELPSQKSKPGFAGEVETFPLQQWTDVAADGPRYFLMIDAAEKHWIMESGRYAGETTWFGPLTLEEFQSLLKDTERR